MNFPTRILEMLPTRSKPGQTVHDERSVVVQDRREAAKALAETIRMTPQDWGEFNSPQERWQVAVRLIDLDWRYGSGRMSEYPPAEKVAS